MIEVAVIGGTGVYDPGMLADITDEKVLTPYGEVEFKAGEYAGRRVAFIPRHGHRHSIPPHLINYRANIWAMKKIGVKFIIATTAVGSLQLDKKPGDFVLVDQFIDCTKSRVSTFYEGGERGVVHVDMTQPYCPDLRRILQAAAEELAIPVHKVGTYVCTEGPRFETAAEVRLYASWSGDVVGMTNVPECVLAREAEMCYATVSMVTNYGAGITENNLTHKEVLDTMAANGEKIKNLIMNAIAKLDSQHISCGCGTALQEFGGFKQY